MLIVNGTTIENVVYNGQDLDKLIYNDVVVFEKSGFNAEQVLIDFDYIRNSDGTYTITDWKGTYQGQESTECIVPNKKEIRLYTKTITSSINNYYEIQYTKNLDLNFQIYGFTNKDFEDLKIEVIVSNQDSCIYNNYTLTTINDMQTNLIIKLQSRNPGVSNVKINITSGKHLYSKNIVFKVLEWIIQPVPASGYPIKLNSSGFYETGNKTVADSYSLCKVTIINPSKKNVYLDCLHYTTYSSDYGYLSKLNTPFSSNTTKDKDNLIYYNFYQKHTPNEVVTVNYGPIEGDIYIKYLKGWGHQDVNACLQFKIRIE